MTPEFMGFTTPEQDQRLLDQINQLDVLPKGRKVNASKENCDRAIEILRGSHISANSEDSDFLMEFLNACRG